VQATIGHPLTVHGTGGQTRAFININNTVRCIELAIAHPPQSGERVRIFNQMTETHRIRDLAMKVERLTGVEIAYIANPRKEAEENELDVDNRSLLTLGLEPITLDDGLLKEITNVVKEYTSRCDVDKIMCTSRW
jgi:UDP-sulfoquinovose synthase